MPGPNVKDLATSLVAVAPSPALSGNSLGVTVSTGTRYPQTGSFDLIAHPADELPTIDNAEQLLATISGDTLTITRAQNGTTAKEIALGWRVSNGVFASHITGAYARGNHTGSQAASTISDLTETVQDIVGAEIVAGSNISATYDDAAGTVTIASSANGATNLTTSRTSISVTVLSDTGTDATINSADASNAGVISAADKSKLDGIQAGATDDLTASEILTAIKTVDGSGSGLDSDTIDGIDSASLLARANHSGTQLASTISDFDTQVRTSRLDQMAAPAANVSANSHKVTNVTDPTSAQDAATKAYVDATAAGIDWKGSVRVATTATGTLATAFANGQAVDGVTLVTGDRILIKDQVTGSENGIYVVAASGAPARASDADTSAEVTGGLAVWVNEGSTNADTGWVVTTNDTVTLGTTALTFAQFSGLGQVTSGAGLTKTGNQLDVGAGTGITVAADSVAIDTTVTVDKTTPQTLANKTLTSPVINTPTGIVKGDVGLGNVDNTSDATKNAAAVTLTNKTLTTPVIGDLTNAVHTHQNNAGGGPLDAAAVTTGTVATARLGSGAASSTTYLRGDQTWATVASGGQTTVTKVVAASGGDYTTLGAAIAAASAGWIIQVLDATTESGAITSALNNLTIIGANRITSLIGLSSNLLTLSGTGVTLMNLGFSVTTGGIVLSGANALYSNGYCSTTGIPTTNHLLMSGADARLEGMYYEYTSATSLAAKSPISVSGANARISGGRFYTNGLTAGGYLVLTSGDGSVVDNNTFKCVTAGQTAGLRLAGAYASATNNYLESSGNVSSIGISVANNFVTIANNNLKSWGIGINCASTLNNLSVTGNNLDIPSSAAWGFSNSNQLNVATFSGNNFIGAGTTSNVGCKFNSSVNRDIVLTGNTFYNLNAGITTGVNSGVSTGMSIVNNQFRFNTTNVTVNNIYHNVNVWANSGLSDSDQAHIIEMKNTSGGTVSIGSPIILKVSTANTIEYTTTTTAGDPLVYGMAGDDITNNGTGSVMLEGTTAGNALRVDGTGTAIAIGDFLTCSTTAGRAIKATAGQTVFAIALAATSTTASIKALIIRPRII